MTAAYKAPPWLQTLSVAGRAGALDLVNPTPAQINFATVATVLSRAPRFGGHTEGGVYSVAQHCEQGARAIQRDTARNDWAAAFLLHDAHEAYIGDMPTPVRDALVAMAGENPLGGPMRPGGAYVHAAINELKRRLDTAIYAAAGLPWPLDAEAARVVKSYDLRMGRTERDARLATPPRKWDDTFTNAAPVTGCDLTPMSEMWARCKFVDAMRELLPINVDSPQKAG